METCARQWCEQQFGAAQLGDSRRTKRLVEIAERMLEHPDWMIPGQMGSVAATKAAYRLLDNDELSHAKIEESHWKETRRSAQALAVTLLIQDTSNIDLSGRAVKGMGRVGNEGGQGLLLHTTLATNPLDKQVLGVLHQAVYRRSVTPLHSQQESRYRRLRRETEARFWSEAVRVIGAAPSASRWVYVADRGADVFNFYTTCRQHNSDILIRIGQDRRARTLEEEATYVIRFLRQLPAQHSFSVEVTDKKKSPRQAHVQLSSAPLTVLPPLHTPETTLAPQWLYGIRVWEAQAPAGADALEWLLVTSLPVETAQDAQTYVGWYAQRPIIEDYHQCLKTGCRLEQRQLHTAQRFERLIAVLGVVAVFLLQLRDQARTADASPASAVLSDVHVAVIAAYLKCSPEQVSARQAWLWIAQKGGYLNRHRDPPPGWQTLWRGWETLQLLSQGYTLASLIPPQ